MKIENWCYFALQCNILCIHIPMPGCRKLFNVDHLSVLGPSGCRNRLHRLSFLGPSMQRILLFQHNCCQRIALLPWQASKWSNQEVNTLRFLSSPHEKWTSHGNRNKMCWSSKSKNVFAFWFKGCVLFIDIHRSLGRQVKRGCHQSYPWHHFVLEESVWLLKHMLGNSFVLSWE